ncbi:hypothetical protein [Roseofilum capinflatum]|uniref:Uncharacterized protein n=1 Tax=Roseofilum capinflatum BLCC-M114 TaxID=3022440 RepID=A0ABT7B6D2_9CYAN|nr:hypothetical protein [Roseofilum capinflatum]MDJ1174737.1 hypothetical protein [Roseofilum capinflatum BLCC-M114]
MSNNNLLTAAVAGAVAILVPGMMVYYNFNERLDNAQDEIKQLQANLDQTTQQLQDKESVVDEQAEEISELEGKVSLSQQTLSTKEQELNTRVQEIRRLHNDLGTVSKCLTGVVEVIDASERGDEAGVILSLVGLEEPCEKSERIIQEVENFENSSGYPYPGNNPPIQTSN